MSDIVRFPRSHKTDQLSPTFPGVTGRDDFIIAKALFYAVKYIDALPEWLQETSDQNDMARILSAIAPDYVAHRQALNDLYLNEVGANGGVANNNVDQIDRHHIVRHSAIPQILVG
jgi:hypothetical protein